LRVAFAAGDPEAGVASVRVGLLRGAVVDGAAVFAGVPLKAASTDADASSMAALQPDAAAFVELMANATGASVSIPANLSDVVHGGDPVALAVVLSVTNSLGLESRWRTDGVVVDASPPACACAAAGCSATASGVIAEAALPAVGLVAPVALAQWDADGSATVAVGTAALSVAFSCTDDGSGVAAVTRTRSGGTRPGARGYRPRLR
jgi:hypothetical protein